MEYAGIGVDIVEIARMERALARTPSLAARVFTEGERADCAATVRPAAHFAERFAAREAVLKALGIGFSDGVGLKDVSVALDDAARPRVVLAGRALEVARERGVIEVELSLSCTDELAVANAITITEGARPAVASEPESARARVAREFREVRSILDELDRLEAGGLVDADEEAGDEACA